MAVRVAIIADDLTGALDSIAPFAARGLTSSVFLSATGLDGAELTSCDVVGISTASREMEKPEAAAAVRAAAGALSDLAPKIVFKKIDSRLKGHIDAESAACADVFCKGRRLVAPAIPDFGRRVAGGVLCGEGIAEPIHLADRFSGPFTAPDVTSNIDFEAIADEILADGNVLPVGARGLAEGIARRLGDAFRPPPAIRRPLLFAIGSVDPITRVQLNWLRLHLRGALDTRIMATPDVQTGLDQEPARRFAIEVATAVRAGQPSTLVVSGGETASLVLAALGIARLEVDGECEAGIGQSRIKMPYGPLTLLTKSGGFGTKETLLSLLKRSATAA